MNDNELIELWQLLKTYTDQRLSDGVNNAVGNRVRVYEFSQ